MPRAWSKKSSEAATGSVREPRLFEGVGSAPFSPSSAISTVFTTKSAGSCTRTAKVSVADPPAGRLPIAKRHSESLQVHPELEPEASKTVPAGTVSTRRTPVAVRSPRFE